MPTLAEQMVGGVGAHRVGHVLVVSSPSQGWKRQSFLIGQQNPTVPSMGLASGALGRGLVSDACYNWLHSVSSECNRLEKQEEMRQQKVPTETW